MKVTEQTYGFIAGHLKDSPDRLRLKYSGKQLPGVDIPLAVTQIDARRKAASKLSEILEKHADFLFPDTLSAEQCTAWPIARLHAEIAGSQDDVLDLTCGLGIDTLALARVAQTVTACDLNPEHIEYIVHNAAVLGVHNITALCCESGAYLNSLQQETRYSLIFADPARRNAHNKRTFALEDCSPDILKLLPAIRNHTSRLLIKVSPMLDVDMVVKQLPDVSAVYAVSLKGECKELLLDCNFDEKSDNRLFVAIDVRSNGEMTKFGFEERQGDCNTVYISDIDEVVSGKYLFEPNASLMKMLHRAPLSRHFPTLRKLGMNTHLFISEQELPADMPGRVMRIDRVMLPSKKALKELPEHANIVTRNYPESADALRSKLKINDGGTQFIYACRVLDKKSRLLVCTPHT